MNRRKFLTKTALASALVSIPKHSSASSLKSKNKSVLTVAHITDVHIRPEENVPSRAIEWL